MTNPSETTQEQFSTMARRHARPSYAYGRPLDERPIALVAKRVVDVVLASIALIVLLPVMALIALAIRLDSPGPIFFSQVRIGRDRRREPETHHGPERRKRRSYGSPFQILKFRTMYADSDPYAPSPVSGDDRRVTRIGAFLRRSSLDELPQLINVLRGEMSLVGPRPEMPFLVERYGDLHRRRLSVSQGLTGPWQLWGPRDRLIHEAIEWDLWYVRRWSVWLDLGLLFKTFLFVVKARNR